MKGISELGRSTQGVKVMNVADKDKVCAVAIASTGKKKAKKAAPADENQMGLARGGERGRHSSPSTTSTTSTTIWATREKRRKSSKTLENVL